MAKAQVGRRGPAERKGLVAFHCRFTREMSAICTWIFNGAVAVVSHLAAKANVGDTRRF